MAHSASLHLCQAGALLCGADRDLCQPRRRCVGFPKAVALSSTLTREAEEAPLTGHKAGEPWRGVPWHPDRDA